MKVSINSLTSENITGHYDLCICAVGYETRASYCWNRFAQSCDVPDNARFVITFSTQQCLKYEDNKRFFSSNKFHSLPDSTSALKGKLVPILNKISSSESQLVRILIDISSITRTHIALVTEQVASLAMRCGKKILVDFVYARAVFSAPSAYGPIRFRGPVIPEFSGWSLDNESPTGLILGIGYEADVGLGFLEELEPEKVVLFKPTGHENEYTRAIDNANHDLISQVGMSAVIDYDISDPHAMLAKLVTVCNQMMTNYRPVLIPFGPRIFALGCCICALMFGHKIAVWRVSPVESNAVADRLPSGDIACIQVAIDP